MSCVGSFTRLCRAHAAAGGFECVACSTCNTQAGLEEADACGLVDTLCQCAPGKIKAMCCGSTRGARICF